MTDPTPLVDASTWYSVQLLVGLVCTTAGFGFGYAMLLNRVKRSEDANEETKVALAAAMLRRQVATDAAALRHDVLTKELSDFKERVAKDYATTGVLERLEGKMITAMERLGDRIDKVGDLITKSMVKCVQPD